MKTFTPKDPTKYDHARRLYLDKVPLQEIAMRLVLPLKHSVNGRKREHGRSDATQSYSLRKHFTIS